MDNSLLFLPSSPLYQWCTKKNFKFKKMLHIALSKPLFFEYVRYCIITANKCKAAALALHLKKSLSYTPCILLLKRLLCLLHCIFWVSSTNLLGKPHQTNYCQISIHISLNSVRCHYKFCLHYTIRSLLQ